MIQASHELRCLVKALHLLWLLAKAMVKLETLQFSLTNSAASLLNARTLEQNPMLPVARLQFFIKNKATELIKNKATIV